MNDLIKEMFVRAFKNRYLEKLPDAASISWDTPTMAFTTDSYVVDPLFFPGGDIGKLAVCGTVNDLAVSGATPLYLSAGFIIEEGLKISVLKRIVQSMAAEAQKAGVKIVTGDTKVVPRGKADKLFINTAGVGCMHACVKEAFISDKIKNGDKILVNGHLGEHAIAILSARNEMHFESEVLSDCACLNGLLDKILQKHKRVCFMRDITRGGLATILCELASALELGLEIYEERVPVSTSVKGACDLLGYDPLYLANEGKVMIIADAAESEDILRTMQNHPLGEDARIIGEVVQDHPGMLICHTSIGSKRIVNMLSGEMLPRIC